jgi:hypothetical protein
MRDILRKTIFPELKNMFRHRCFTLPIKFKLIQETEIFLGILRGKELEIHLHK